MNKVISQCRILDFPLTSGYQPDNVKAQALTKASFVKASHEIIKFYLSSVDPRLELRLPEANSRNFQTKRDLEKMEQNLAEMFEIEIKKSQMITRRKSIRILWRALEYCGNLPSLDRGPQFSPGENKLKLKGQTAPIAVSADHMVKMKESEITEKIKEMPKK